MSIRIPNLFDTVRQPEYTGSNRCMPCTVVNILIATIVSVLAGLGVSVGVGISVFAICTAAIYFRGYLVPGTPTLTKRYLPDRLHRLFGTHHIDPPETTDSTRSNIESAEGGASDATSESSAGQALLAENVVTECLNGDDLCLDSTFRTAWRSRITDLREHDTGAEHLAAHIDVDPSELVLANRDGEYAVLYQGDRIDAWPSRAAFLADMAVEPTLSEWCSDWDEFDPAVRTRIIASLRAFLEQCPACDTELETAESAWESCCREGTDVTITCENCGDLVFTGRY